MKKREMIRYLFFTSFFVLSVLLMSSCEDKYEFNDKNPPLNILDADIYTYLSGQGNYTNFLRITSSIPISYNPDGSVYETYSDFLRKTGTSTVFVAPDSAFKAFYASDNEWGVHSFEDFTPTQLKTILYSSLLREPFTLEMLSSTKSSDNQSLLKGNTMRRPSSRSVTDTIAFEKGNILPNNRFWERFKDKGIYVVTDSVPTLVFFLNDYLKQAGITKENGDLNYIMKDPNSTATKSVEDNYFFNVKILQSDIFCKNGYVNIVNELIIPRDNLAESIRKDPNLSLFNSFLERFSVPYYDQSITSAYKLIHPEVDSVFIKCFFSRQVGDNVRAPIDPLTNKPVTQGYGLNFDPAKNNFSSTANDDVMPDMGVIFAPTNQALMDYFEGSNLQKNYGSWENVPDNVLLSLVNNHMRLSFKNSLPSKFDKMEDKMGEKIPVEKEQIEYSKICSNGITYVVNDVYSPTEYISVSAPVAQSSNTKVFNWAVNMLEFDLYLLSQVNQYAFFVPTDDVFKNYLDPVSLANTKNGSVWDFNYDEEAGSVWAKITSLDEGSETELYSVISRNPEDPIQNRLLDILDYHVVVGGLKESKNVDANFKPNKFYQTKGGGNIKVEVLNPSNNTINVQGGGNIERGEMLSVKETFPKPTDPQDDRIKNGATYFLTGLTTNILQAPTKSVYSVLENTENLSSFFALCNSIQEVRDPANKVVSSPIFLGKNGITLNVSFFSTYNYTVYAPSNEAIKEAKDAGRFMEWDEIEQLEEVDKAREAKKLYDFICYHFQDNSVYASGFYSDKKFETASRFDVEGTSIKNFKKIRVVENDNQGLKIYTESNPGFDNINLHAPTVIIPNSSTTNIMVRDYEFDLIKNIINTSSFIVIHQIEKVLDFN